MAYILPVLDFRRRKLEDFFVYYIVLFCSYYFPHKLNILLYPFGLICKNLRCEGFEFSEDARACADLISSYEAGDNECFQEIFQRPLLKSMDNEVCFI